MRILSNNLKIISDSTPNDKRRYRKKENKLLRTYFESSIVGNSPVKKRKLLEFVRNNQIRKFEGMSTEKKIGALRIKLGNMKRIWKDKST